MYMKRKEKNLFYSCSVLLTSCSMCQSEGAWSLNSILRTLITKTTDFDIISRVISHFKCTLAAHSWQSLSPWRQYGTSEHSILGLLMMSSTNSVKYCQSFCDFWSVVKYSESSLQRQHLFPKKLTFKWICCCKESLIDRMICKKDRFILISHWTYVLDIC